MADEAKKTGLAEETNRDNPAGKTEAVHLNAVETEITVKDDFPDKPLKKYPRRLGGDIFYFLYNLAFVVRRYFYIIDWFIFCRR